MLAGLNVGLLTGLGMAYLPDQHSYGPTWQRVLMVDLAGLAGAVIGSAVEICSRSPKKNDTSQGAGTPSSSEKNYCANAPGSINARTARFSLIGAGLGLIAGWLLTSNFDQQPTQSRSSQPPLSLLPLPSAFPVQSKTGTVELLPGLLSQGRF